MTAIAKITDREELEREYDLAKRNPDLRADFVKRLYFEEFEPFVGRVIMQSNNDRYYAAVCKYELKRFSSNYGSKTKRFPMNLTPAVFDELTLDDFLSIIVDHEGRHTKFYHDRIDAMICPDLISVYDKLSLNSSEITFDCDLSREVSDHYLCDFMKEYDEIVAYTNQLLKSWSGKRPIRNKLRGQCIERINQLYVWAAADLNNSKVNPAKKEQLEELLKLEMEKLK